MEYPKLIELLNGDESTLVNGIVTVVKPLFDSKRYLEYDPSKHKVQNKWKRKDKDVFVPNGEQDEKGNDKLIKQKVAVNRISVPLQKIIVRRNAAFLVGGKIKLDASITNDTDQALYNAVWRTWQDNKLQYKNRRIAKIMMSQCECAEVWFSNEFKDRNGKEVVEMKMTIIEPNAGNTLYPVFDSTGKMIAFGYTFEVDNKRQFYLYDDELIRKYSEDSAGKWVLIEKPVEHNYGKIPVIYYWQEAPEWDDVQVIIERLETLISNWSDTNDYNGSPILKLKGAVEGMVAKGEAGKAFQMDKEADVDYVTWDNAPESVRLEMENLIAWIFSGTGTPNLSPEFLKALGELSGAALDRILIDAHLKAQDRQDDVFGECIQRRVNFLMAAHIAIDDSLEEAEFLDISPVYSLFRINDDNERIQNASLAVGGKPIMSLKTAVAYAGIVNDVETEVDAIENENDPLEGAE